MIKKLIKILSGALLVVVLMILYLSFVGIKTEKFNKRITNKIEKINKKINLDLKDVQFLLDPYSFSVNITTKNSTILLGSKRLQIKDIKTNISLKALIYDEFSIDDLQISTKKIKLKDLILLARSFKNLTSFKSKLIFLLISNILLEIFSLNLLVFTPIILK